ncbi:MAG: hypothetical protein ACLS58_07710 [Sutterella wadsworthensis]
MTDANFDTNRTVLRRGPLADPRSHEMVLDAYAPDAPPRRDHRLPLRATEQLPGFGHDHHGGNVLRDEGEVYARKLIEAGVHVACVLQQHAS